MTTEQQRQPAVQALAIKVKAKINLTADDWQLYNLPGRDTAARRMNRALEKKLAKGEIGSLHEVLAPHRKWGSMDSEGYHAIEFVLAKMGLDADKFI